MTKKSGLMERLNNGESVICAEGYLFELERRGYLQAGAFVPEVVLEHPEMVESLHREFVHAGSDIVEAFTYYAHREKMRVIGREDDLERINRQALEIAKKVATDTNTLLAGNICNTNVYNPNDEDALKQVRQIFEEQIQWAVDADVDFIVAETFSFTGEALMALEMIKETGLPAVVTFAVGSEEETIEGDSFAEAGKKLEDAGADVVGLNCLRGPWTMLPVLEEMRKMITCHMAALPVPYRTTPDRPNFQALRDDNLPEGCPCCLPEGQIPFPEALDPFTCTRYEIAEFTKRCEALNIKYLGVCCGAAPHHIRSMAEALGRKPEASRYSADLSKHFFLGDYEGQSSYVREATAGKKLLGE